MVQSSKCCLGRADGSATQTSRRSFESGEAAYKRYGHLVSQQLLPFVRASGIDRIIKSAGNWTVGKFTAQSRGVESTSSRLTLSTGFAASSHHHINPVIDQVLSEEVNNTLNNDCPNAKDGTEEKNVWLDVFAPPIVKRLKKAAKKAKVTDEDVHRYAFGSQGRIRDTDRLDTLRLMALCPFETVAFERPSPFCDLFTPDEWESLEYYGDVEKYYKTGCVV